MTNPIESKNNPISQVGIKKKLEKKEFIKETSQQQHANDAAPNLNPLSSIVHKVLHKASNRGK